MQINTVKKAILTDRDRYSKLQKSVLYGLWFGLVKMFPYDDAIFYAMINNMMQYLV